MRSIIKGDKKIPAISAASIIAKVTRDKMIGNLAKKIKGYNWGQNFGYGTREHLKAIKTLGATSHHRKTFSPICKLKQVSRRNTRYCCKIKFLHYFDHNNSIPG